MGKGDDNKGINAGKYCLQLPSALTILNNIVWFPRKSLKNIDIIAM